MDDVNNIAQFDVKKDDEKDENAEEEGSELEEENNHLKNDLAAMSFKLAKLFNAAYDYGDAKLLDYLQSAIGLT